MASHRPKCDLEGHGDVAAAFAGLVTSVRSVLSLAVGRGSTHFIHISFLSA
jgi:hypothetical protein